MIFKEKTEFVIVNQTNTPEEEPALKNAKNELSKKVWNVLKDCKYTYDVLLTNHGYDLVEELKNQTFNVDEFKTEKSYIYLSSRLEENQKNAIIQCYEDYRNNFRI
jgi:hypothetical protein